MTFDTTNETPPSEGLRGWNGYIELGLRAAGSLRRTLHVDETTYRAGFTLGAARDYFVYSVLGEVEKAAIDLQMLQRDFDETTLEGPDDGDRVTRSFVEVLVEELQLRVRRVCEAFLATVLFSTTDAPAYFEHYSLLTELSYVIGRNDDLAEFHGGRSMWTERRLEQLLGELRACESGIDFARAWYLHPDHRRAFRATPVRRPKLSTQAERLRAALTVMDPGETFVLGASYDEAYGAPSSVVHYSARRVARTSQAEDLRLGTRLGLMIFHLVRRVHLLCGRPAAAQAEQIARAIESNPEYVRHFEMLNTKPELGVGDFVVAHGFAAEIERIHTSRYGHRSFEVAFVAGRPPGDLERDVVQARFLVLLRRRQQATAEAGTDDGAVLRTWVRDEWIAGRLRL